MFSLYLTQSTLSHHTYTSKPLSSLSIFRLITSTHAGRILYFGRNWPKQPGTPETHRNSPKFDPRWNRRDYCSSLYAGTKFSGHSGRNGTELITMVLNTLPNSQNISDTLYLIIFHLLLVSSLFLFLLLLTSSASSSSSSFSFSIWVWLWPVILGRFFHYIDGDFSTMREWQAKELRVLGFSCGFSNTSKGNKKQK